MLKCKHIGFQLPYPRSSDLEAGASPTPPPHTPKKENRGLSQLLSLGGLASTSTSVIRTVGQLLPHEVWVHTQLTELFKIFLRDRDSSRIDLELFW